MLRLRTLCSLSALTALLNAAPSPAQTEQGDFVIRVNTREVVVPVGVFNKEKQTGQMVIENRLVNYFTYWVNDLTAENFRVFEDGAEQKVAGVTAEQVRLWPITDNLGSHFEYSLTPRGVWATSDAQRISQDFLNLPMLIYMVSYTPPTSPEGVCHGLEVEVKRRNTAVISRKEYCSVPNSPADPLNGSNVDKQLTRFADSEEPGVLPILGQVIVFAGRPGASQLEIALEFPEGRNPGVSGTGPTGIEILGIVYDKKGNLVRRFSDISGPSVSAKVGTSKAVSLFQFRYEMQTTLLPGDYNLKIVATDGKRFGRMEQSIEVPEPQSKGIDISGIALCRRHHKPLDAQPTNLRPTEFLPLSAKGMEFTPAGNTHFKRDEQLVAFFEIYAPQNEETAFSRINLDTKLTNANTDKLEVDTGLRPIDSDFQPGNPVIPVVWDLDIAKLSPGKYRLEMQVSDSSGNETAWRVATFSVE